MPTNAKAYLGRFKSIFGGFTNGQRAVTVIAVVVAIVGGVVFMSWLQKPTMTPLFTNLSSTDASSITEKLSEAGTAYELEDGGKTVLVPGAVVNQTRIDLAGSGLPAGSGDGSDGYSLLDKQGISSSDRQQRMAEKRAIEGELQNAIESLDKVAAAKVLLALPESSVFTEEQAATTASVVVTMKSSTKLETGKVDAIVHLVSTAVPNLDSKNVTVSDSTGALLSAAGETGTAGGNDARLALAQTKASAIEAKVTAMLEKVLGPGNASVSAQVELAWDDTTTKTSEYLPGKATDPPVTEDSTNESYTGAGGVGTGGVLGPDNSVGSGTTSSSSKDSKYSKTTTKRTNAVGTKVTETKPASGAVKRITLATMINTKAATQLQRAEAARIIAAAAGLDTARGDSNEVGFVAFDTTAGEAAKVAAEEEASAARQDQLIGLGKNVGLGLAVLLALLIGFKKSRKKGGGDSVNLGELPSAGQYQGLSAGGGRAAAALEYQLDDDLPALEAPAIDPQSDARVLARAEIGALVQEEPDEVARLLRGWMSDRS